MQKKILETKLEIMEKRLKDQEECQKSRQSPIIIQNNGYLTVNNFNITFTLPGEEKIAHISEEELMSILDEKDINQVLKRIMEQVFFHPSVPENMKWCVVDKNVPNGTLNFNHIKNCLTKVNTDSKINEHVQNTLLSLINKFGELEDQGKLSHIQSTNYNRLGGLIGEQLEKDQLFNVKNIAYERQVYPKTLWESLKLMLIDEFKSK